MFKKRRVTGFLFLAFTVIALAAKALTPADQKEIQQFQLTEDFWRRYTAVMNAGPIPGTNGETITDPNKAAAMMSSLDSLTAKVSSSPQTVALLAKHGLTPRQAVVGNLVLMRAAMADAMLANPAMAKYVDRSKKPSPVNMAFYRAHKAEITKLMQKQSEEEEQ